MNKNYTIKTSLKFILPLTNKTKLLIRGGYNINANKFLINEIYFINKRRNKQVELITK